MKRISHIKLIYSLSALSVIAPMTYADPITPIDKIPIGEEENVYELIQENNFATIPKLEGGPTASIGAFYAVPSSDFNSYFFTQSMDQEDYSALNVNPGYEFGFEASLGYVFKNSANSVELFFRDLNTSDNASQNDVIIGDKTPQNASSNLDYHLRGVDLMFGQFVDLGQQVQVRLVAGVAYAELKRDQDNLYTNTDGSSPIAHTEISDYKGVGPRIGIDARYDFGQGFGIVGSGSLAYLLGKMQTSNIVGDTVNDLALITDNNDDQGVMNFRGNLGVDYVYFFENEQHSTMGIEVGYLIDYYDDSVRNVNILFASNAPPAPDYETTEALSFSGPYVNLKAVF